jgi:glycosyltransferase involved in cell wall biosynthesis
MGTYPIISVIIPAYNAQEYVIETLESLESQTFKDFEVIIINDGSKDNTSILINKFINKKTLDIRIIEQINSGVSIARNCGIDIASGDYVVFLDADDLLHPSYLSILYKTLTKQQVDVVICNFTRKQNFREIKILENNLVKINQVDLFNLFFLKSKQYIFPCFLYSRRIINQFELRFTNGIKYGEDLEFICKYISHISKGILVENELYYYRPNKNSAISNVSWNFTDSIHAINNISNYLEINHNPKYIFFSTLAKAREICYVLRAFAKTGQKDLFLKAYFEFQFKRNVKYLFRFPVFRIRISAWIIYLNPKLFYHLIRLFKF